MSDPRPVSLHAGGDRRCAESIRLFTSLRPPGHRGRGAHSAQGLWAQQVGLHSSASVPSHSEGAAEEGMNFPGDNGFIYTPVILKKLMRIQPALEDFIPFVVECLQECSKNINKFISQ